MSKDVEMTVQTILAAFDENDNKPEVQFNPVGRLRLVGALSKKFGSSFRNVSKASAALKAFDSEMGFAAQIESLRRR